MSVIIPAFQSQARIGRTLSRLDRQTFSDFEIIVVNDGSTDETSATVRRLMDADPRIRVIEQTNQGIAAARNRGIEAARGAVLAFLDDDDLWLPRKLELQLARLDAVPQAAVVSCFSALVDTEGRLLGWRFGGQTEGDVYREMLEWDMIWAAASHWSRAARSRRLAASTPRCPIAPIGTSGSGSRDGILSPAFLARWSDIRGARAACLRTTSACSSTGERCSPERVVRIRVFATASIVRCWRAISSEPPASASPTIGAGSRGAISRDRSEADHG